MKRFLLTLLTITSVLTFAAERGFVTALYCSGDGELWEGTSGGIKVLNQGALKAIYTIKSPFGTLDHAITAIGADRRGAIWVTTHNYAYCYDEDNDSIVAARDIDYIRAGLPIGCRVIINHDGHITATKDKKLYIPERRSNSITCGDSVLYATSAVAWLASGKILNLDNGRKADAGITPTEGGARIFTTRDHNEIWIYDIFAPQCRRFSMKSMQPLQLPAQMSDEIVKCIAETGDNRIAIATNHSGLLMLNAATGTMTSIYRDQGNHNILPSNHITALFDDGATNKLWIGTSEGTAHLPSITTEVKISNTGIAENISSFAVDSHNRLWIAFDGAGLYMSRPGSTESRRFTVKNGLPSNAVTFIHPYGGNIVGATYGGGMFVIGPDENISPLPGAGKNSALARSRQFVRDRSGALWISTFSSGIGRLEKESLKMFNSFNSAMKTDYVTGIAISPDSTTVYVASGYGIYAIDTASFVSRELPTGDDMPVAATCIAVDNDGNVWFGTASGIRKVGSDYTLLAGEGIIAITADTNGVFATTSNGLYQLSTEGEKPVFHSLLSSTELPNGFRLAKYALTTTPGALYAGGFGNYLRINFSEATPHAASTSTRWWVIIIVACLFAITIIFTYRRFFRHKNTPVTKIVPKKEVGKVGKVEEVENTAITNPDNEFLSRIDSIIAQHIGDSDFTVENFGAETGMSRSNLYKKVMAVTGKSPTEYLRDVRLKRGHRMLQVASASSVGASVSEIAYSIGMSPRQFSRFYREKYGCLPSETIKQAKEDTNEDIKTR